MSLEIHDKLMDFITRQFSVEKDEIELESSLVDQGIIDSFGLIEIATFIEKQYNLTVSEDQMTKENFGSFVKMVHFIRKEIERLEAIQCNKEENVIEKAGR